MSDRISYPPHVRHVPGGGGGGGGTGVCPGPPSACKSGVVVSDGITPFSEQEAVIRANTAKTENINDFFILNRFKNLSWEWLSGGVRRLAQPSREN
jgi:hypothetical protein